MIRAVQFCLSSLKSPVFILGGRIAIPAPPNGRRISLSNTPGAYCGVAWVGLRSRRAASDRPAVRSTLLVAAAPVAFALAVRPLGLAPAIFCSAMLASLASSETRILHVLALAMALTVASVLLFSYGLGVPTPLIGRLLRL